MTRRTRVLAWACVGAAGLLTVGFMMKALIRRPLVALDAQIVQLRGRLGGLQKERQEFLRAEAEVRAQAPRLFAAEAEEAEARLGALLTTQIVRTGLREADFTRIPTGRRRLPGAEEVGWTIQGEGPLGRVLDLLYLLESEPRLHRVEGLALSPTQEGSRTRLRLRYVTLVLSPSPELPAAGVAAEVSLEGPGRRRYRLITQRDLWRPHVPDAPVPAPVAVSPGAGAAPVADAQLRLRVVSLSSWDGRPEVHLLDDQERRVLVYRPGERLGEGEVSMVDYRPLPAPGKAGLLSHSRLIWRVDTNYWAVEVGQALGDRRPLTPEELPPALQPGAKDSRSP